MMPFQDAVSASHSAVHAALADYAAVDLSWLGEGLNTAGWALAPDALRFLVSLIGHLRPRHVLEFGAGLSTRVMARACTGLRPACGITSVDHDPEFGPRGVRKLQSGREPSCRVCFQLAPLVTRDCGGKLLPVYLLGPDGLASPLPPDLVLIDGPPAVLGGREGVLYQALDFARPGTLVLLDDAHRRDEQTALARWRDNLGEAIDIALLPGFVKGMAVIIVRQPVHRRDLWDHRLCLTRREINSFIPPGESVVLVDQACWGGKLAPRHRIIPFLERDGEYWGPPEDDATAVRELERLRQAGAGFIALVWPAFWWLDHYTGFVRHLRAHFTPSIENDRLILFDLRQRGDRVEEAAQ
jgi:predicted O-methyltransferase YrrM